MGLEGTSKSGKFSTLFGAKSGNISFDYSFFAVDVSYYSLDIAAEQLLWLREYIKNQGLEYWGEERFYKLLVPVMLSKAGIRHVIILDTDVLVLGHLDPLWLLSAHFDSEQLAGLVDDHLTRINLGQHRVYLRSFSLCDLCCEAGP